jgi:hypothetical protein
MRTGMPRGTRRFKAIDDPIAIDHHEAAAREAASLRMLEALALEHPERATVAHPHGTRAPRRMPMPPTTGGSVQSIDFEG